MSQVATCSDKKQVAPIPYAPEGCPVKDGEEKCGETQGLDIIKDFHQLYQEKMSEIDVIAGGDSLQEKVNLQQKWIDDLTEQNRLLAKVIEELEIEAIGRLQHLENKLKNAAKSFSEVIFYLHHDLKSLLKFIKRIREHKNWSINGLFFYEVTWRDLFGYRSKRKILRNKKLDLPENTMSDVKSINLSFEVISQYHTLTKTLKREDLEASAGKDRKTAEDGLDEANKANKDTDPMNQNMDKMHTIFTQEIANKQEIIRLLEREIYKLGDKIIESQKEACLKDDLIKELRKELKKMRNKLDHIDREKNTSVEASISDSPSSLTSEQEFININSRYPESSLIFIRKDVIKNSNGHKGTTESSDSSECGLNETMINNRGLILSCSSEKNIKEASRCTRPTKERSKLTKINRNDDVQRNELDCKGRQNNNKLSIPKHVPVKTYVNNIEYNKHHS